MIRNLKFFLNQEFFKISFYNNFDRFSFKFKRFIKEYPNHIKFCHICKQPFINNEIYYEEYNIDKNIHKDICLNCLKWTEDVVIFETIEFKKKLSETRLIIVDTTEVEKFLADKEDFDTIINENLNNLLKIEIFEFKYPKDISQLIKEYLKFTFSFRIKRLTFEYKQINNKEIPYIRFVELEELANNIRKFLNTFNLDTDIIVDRNDEEIIIVDKYTNENILKLTIEDILESFIV